MVTSTATPPPKDGGWNGIVPPHVCLSVCLWQATAKKKTKTLVKVLFKYSRRRV
ncbi:hypothetical protein LY76DRAFT_589778 [Colletotrichum caudatum]|nr:hypothetical protein LY76DRAFT_589778 [Colletotrichum caudatum]